MENKRVIIVGASSGIGLATALLLKEKGCEVVNISRTMPSADEINSVLPSSSEKNGKSPTLNKMSNELPDLSKINGNVSVKSEVNSISPMTNEINSVSSGVAKIERADSRFNCIINTVLADASVPGDLTAAINQAADGRPVDALIYSAGCSMASPIEYADPSDYHYLFQVNFFGILEAMQAVLPYMKGGIAESGIKACGYIGNNNIINGITNDNSNNDGNGAQGKSGEDYICNNQSCERGKSGEGYIYNNQSEERGKSREDYIYNNQSDERGKSGDSNPERNDQNDGNGGRIIFVSSMGGTLPIAFDAFYSASKAAVDMLAECGDIELRPYNIRVCSVRPGGVKTRFTFKRKIYNAESVKEYADKQKKAVANLAAIEQGGLDPRKVAETVYNVLTAQNPPVKVAVGLKNKAYSAAAKILPNKVVEFFNSAKYGQ